MICYHCFQEIEDAAICPHCGFQGEKDKEKYPLALPHGSVLAGQYIVGRVLGQGGFGITYLAKDNLTGDKVAIKEFLPETMVTRTPESAAVYAYTENRKENFQYGLQGFLEEVQTLAKFNAHPNVVGVHRYFEENGTAYFVMEYIEGISLKTFIKNQGGKITWRQALEVLVPIAEALRAVHCAGIIHRDVTPDNIFITLKNDVKLLDFGSARYSLGDKSESLDVVLKAGYAPKEQYMSRGRQGPYTDIYSLAACFYAAVTGAVPPEALERMDNDTLTRISTRGIDIPMGIEDAILKAMQVHHEYRYQNIVDFVADLQAAATNPAVNNVTTQSGDVPVGASGSTNYGGVPMGASGSTNYGGVPVGAHGSTNYGGVPVGAPGSTNYGGVPVGAHGSTNYGGVPVGAHGSTNYGGVPVGAHGYTNYAPPVQPDPYAQPNPKKVKQAAEQTRNIIIAAAVALVVILGSAGVYLYVQSNSASEEVVVDTMPAQDYGAVMPQPMPVGGGGAMGDTSGMAGGMGGSGAMGDTSGMAGGMAGGGAMGDTSGMAGGMGGGGAVQPAGGGGMPMGEVTVITFTDVGVETAVRQELGNQTGDITTMDVARITTLTLSESNIEDVSDLVNFPMLTTLRLNGNNISDISPLVALTNLTTLNLSDNNISNISALASMTSLTMLDLHNNQITETSSLANLTALTYLNLGINNLTSTDFVANLVNLTELYLNNNMISDISALRNLTGLTTLHLSDNAITSVEALASMNRLEILHLENNDLRAISPLSGLPTTVSLYLSGNDNIEDYTPVEHIDKVYD